MNKFDNLNPIFNIQNMIFELKNRKYNDTVRFEKLFIDELTSKVELFKVTDVIEIVAYEDSTSEAVIDMKWIKNMCSFYLGECKINYKTYNNSHIFIIKGIKEKYINKDILDLKIEIDNLINKKGLDISKKYINDLLYSLFFDMME